MVLPDSSYEDGFTGDQAITGNLEPYDASAGANINTEDLPKPLPFIGALFSCGPKDASQLATLQRKHLAGVLERPVTPPEAQAITYWCYREMQIVSYGLPFGLALSLAQAYKRRNTDRFPWFRVPIEKNETRMVNGQLVRTGEIVHRTLRVMRFSLYAALGAFVAKVVMYPIASITGQSGMLNDPRLKSFRGVWDAQMASDKGLRNDGTSSTSPKSSTPQPRQQFPQDPSAQIQSDGASTEASSSRWPMADDDASPSNDGFLDDNDLNTNATRSDSSMNGTSSASSFPRSTSTQTSQKSSRPSRQGDSNAWPGSGNETNSSTDSNNRDGQARRWDDTTSIEDSGDKYTGGTGNAWDRVRGRAAETSVYDSGLDSMSPSSSSSSSSSFPNASSSSTASSSSSTSPSSGIRRPGIWRGKATGEDGRDDSGLATRAGQADQAFANAAIKADDEMDRAATRRNHESVDTLQTRPRVYIYDPRSQDHRRNF